MTGLRLAAQVVDDFIVIEVGGELDYGSAAAFRERALDLLSDTGSRLIVDLSDVGFMDSSGLGVLVTLWRRAMDRGGTLRLAAPNSAISHMLQWTGLERRLPIFPDVATAIADPHAR